MILIHTLTNYDHPPLMALQSPSSSSSSSSSSSLSPGFTYDVFISFRGADTRFGFTGNLYKALSDKGIYTFFDERELHGGEEITPSLFKAIEESRVAIPVFSSKYASSSFCLDELVHIMECFKAEDRLVLPVFYDVDPSHVRRQIGRYGEEMDKHEARFQNNNDNMERLHKWKMALNQAANLSGHHFKHGSGYEHEFIGKIIEVVSNKINRVPLHVADHPVGLESRVQQVKSLLDVGSGDGVLMVGICGIGGIGKTTLARETYNLIANEFEGSCFLHKVRENSINHLQKKLLSKTIGSNIEIGDVNEGISIIRRRLHRKKVLLILDDVDKLEQLTGLAGGPDWFGLGSRVIITTRDKQLVASHGIERIYEVDGLNKEEALELLRWKAFKNNIVDSSYEYFLNRAVNFASGLPLALEVVGSNLYRNSIEEWKYTLDCYERSPDEKIQNILKVSFDALGQDTQSVFLDIACCFKGYRLDELERILHAHYGYFMNHHIKVLVGKSLIKINPYVTLHDLIEDMGKEIVRQESPKKPGKRSRLWLHEDIVHVFEENSGTSKIEIIHLKFPKFPHSSEGKIVQWKGDGFKKMKGLKTLIIKSGYYFKGLDHLPNSLRIMDWDGYPSEVLPSDFCPKKLSICRFTYGRLTSAGLRGSLKEFVNMRVLFLYELFYFTHIPDVSSLLNLEELHFDGCINLISIHESVGFLNKLKILRVKRCSKLKSFPPTIRLTSLRQLELSNCTSLKIFPKILGEMGNIAELHLDNTAIKELPSSFQYLTGLLTLQFEGSSGLLSLPSSILMMPKLSMIRIDCCRLLPKQNDNLSPMVSSNVEKLMLTRCDLSDDVLQTVLRWFAKVKTLKLARSDFTILPECIKECRFLRELCLDDCKCLREIRGVPPNLKVLSARDQWCGSLTSSIVGSKLLMSQELHEAGGTHFNFRGTPGIPEWFDHRSKGGSISFWFRNKIPSIALFVANKSHIKILLPKLIINDHVCSPDEGIYFERIMPNHTSLHDMELPNLKYNMDEAISKNEWIHAEVTSFNEIPVSSWMSIEIGIHVFKQKSSMEDIQFTDPGEKSIDVTLTSGL